MHEHAARARSATGRWSIARTLRTWRAADELLGDPSCAADRAAYERAVAEVMHELGRCRSFADLLDCYAALVGADPAPPEVPDPLRAVVEGAAFWRRLREMVAEAAG
jgi:hypothetical protein